MFRGIAGPYAPILRIKPFRRLLFGIGVSSFGDGLSALAITWLALSLAAPSTKAIAVSFALAAYSVPGAAGSLLFARVMRKLSGRHAAIIDGLWRACLLLMIPAAHSIGGLTLPVLLVLLAMSSLFSAWGKAGRYVLLDELVPDANTQAGNSAANVVLEGAFVAGPLVAAGLLVFLDASLVIGLDAITFLVLAAVYAFGIKDPDQHVSLARPPDRSKGFAAIFRSRIVLAFVGVSLLLFFFSGPIDVAIPLKVADAGQHAGYFAGYLASFGIGGFLGALVGGYLRQGSLITATVVSVAGVGAFSLLAGVLPTGALGWLAYGLAGLCWGPFPSATTTFLQKSVPRASLASVLAARSAIQIFALPLGAVIGGPVVGLIGPGQTIAVASVLILILGAAFALIFGFAPARIHPDNSSVRSEPDPTEDS